jgi:hypothetical protein
MIFYCRQFSPCKNRLSLFSRIAIFVATALFCSIAFSQSSDDQVYAQAVKDFNENRFTASLTEFNQVQGRHAKDAQDYIARINAYWGAIKAAAEFATKRTADEVDLKSINFAIQQYQRAIDIKPHGPFNAEEKLRELEERKIQLEERTPPHGTVIQSDDESGDAAILADAKKAYARNDFDTAQNLFEKLEGENQTADDYLNKISRYWSAISRAKQLSKSGKYEDARISYLNAANIKPDGPQNPRAGALNMELSEGVEQFYAGDYDGAINHLEEYVNSNAEKQPLAHFYLGASKLARAFVSGDDALRQAGLKDLRNAKQAGFKADAQGISPKIMQSYSELTF